MATTMWEIRAAGGRLDELLEWVLGRVDPSARVYRSNTGEERMVVIDSTGQAGRQLADPPAELIARPGHVWEFSPVRNG
jgi:hypothetical protein